MLLLTNEVINADENETSLAVVVMDVMWMVLQKLHSSDAARRHEYSLHDSRRPDNRCRNRYRDVVPCKLSQFCLRLVNFANPFSALERVLCMLIL